MEQLSEIKCSNGAGHFAKELHVTVLAFSAFVTQLAYFLKAIQSKLVSH